MGPTTLMWNAYHSLVEVEIRVFKQLQKRRAQLKEE
jgi:hypothetical protein